MLATNIHAVKADRDLAKKELAAAQDEIAILRKYGEPSRLRKADAVLKRLRQNPPNA